MGGMDRARRRRGASDNAPIIREILALRAEQARLLGYENFADYRLDDTMAKTSAAVELQLVDGCRMSRRRQIDGGASKAMIQIHAHEAIECRHP